MKKQRKPRTHPAAIVPELECGEIIIPLARIPMPKDMSVRLTEDQADQEQADRIARASNYAPVDSADCPLRTADGFPVVAFEIARASGMHIRRHPAGAGGRFLRTLVRFL